MFSGFFFQKEAFESSWKIEARSSAENSFSPGEITWITWKSKQNVEIWPFLKSDLEISVLRKWSKIGPATGVNVNLTPVAGSIFGSLSQTHISKSEFKNGHITRLCSVFK